MKRLWDSDEETNNEEYTDGDDNKLFPGDVISFEFGNDDSSWHRDKYSSEVEVEGLPWKAHVYIRRDKHKEDQLTVSLHSMENDSGLWSISLYYKITLVNSSDRMKDIRKEYNHTFKHDATKWSENVMKWSELNDMDGFINNGKIKVDISFAITESTGIRTIPHLDLIPNYSRMPRPCQDVTLVIEGKEIHVGRQILALYSPVFNSMFYRDFVEKNKKEIELEGINREEFIDMLNLIYPSHSRITDDDVEPLLILADRFHINKVINEVEHYLIEYSKMCIFDKRDIAEKYKLDWLDKHCNTRRFYPIIPQPRVTKEFKSISRVADPEFTIDYFDSKEPRHDVTLVINGEKIYVSKQFLSLHSRWFARKLSYKKELNLDVDREEFLEMLRVIYPSHARVKDKNVNFLLKLANRFQIKFLFDIVEDYLIFSDDLRMMSKLLISDQYKLIKLQDYIFTVSDVYELDKLKKRREYRQLSDKTKLGFMEAMTRKMKGNNGHVEWTDEEEYTDEDEEETSDEDDSDESSDEDENQG